MLAQAKGQAVKVQLNFSFLAVQALAAFPATKLMMRLDAIQ